MLGDVARMSGTPREAKIWYSQCLAAAQAQKNQWGQINALRDLGWAARNLMAYDEARDYYLESLKLAENCQNPWEVVRTTESLGYLALFLGDLDQASIHFSQAVKISEDMGSRFRTLPSQIHIGLSQWMQGAFEPQPVVSAPTPCLRIS